MKKKGAARREERKSSKRRVTTKVVWKRVPEKKKERGPKDESGVQKIHQKSLGEKRDFVKMGRI